MMIGTPSSSHRDRTRASARTPIGNGGWSSRRRAYPPRPVSRHRRTAPTRTRPVVPHLPVLIAKALKTNHKAWKFFRQLAPTHRRQFVVWIHLAKRPETRDKCIHESIALLEPELLTGEASVCL